MKNKKVKQPERPTLENQKFQQKLDELKNGKFDSLQDFITALDALN